MRTNNSLLACLAIAGVLVSCNSGVGETSAEGLAMLSLDINAGDGFTTRAVDESSYRNSDNYSVDVIETSTGNVIESYSPGAVLGLVTVPFGTYTVKAYMGEEKAASRDVFLSQGEATVNLSSGEYRSVTVNCTPTCGKAMVKFSSDMDTYFSNYYVEYSTPSLGSAKAVWAKADTEPWYLAVAAGAGSEVKATIHLTPRAEYDINQTHTDGATSEGTVVKTYTLKRNKAWTLNIAPNYSSSQGTLGLTITIDDTTEDSVINVEIPSEWI